MQRDRSPLARGAESFERLAPRAVAVDGAGLLALLIHREHRQRFSSSSSISIAVVVRKIITGPSTRYSCVTSRPVAGSLPVDAMVSSPSLCSSFSA